MNKEQQATTKLQLKTSDELWKQVQEYKIKRNLENNNQAVEELIRAGLSPIDSSKDIFTDSATVPEETLSEIKTFENNIPTYEKANLLPLLILKDKKSCAYYTECHILAFEFEKLGDIDTTIDPELQEEFRANRELDLNNYYYLQMVDDAKNGRQFSDIVIEYNTEYREQKPLKILGGQHRHQAIVEALKDKVDEIHGIKVYFNLGKNQRAEIMRISNTNINVSPDLRDRIEEHRLSPAGMLRDFCYATGIMTKGEDFGDKKRYEDFNPTVRMIRSFIVNFYKGKQHKDLNIDEDAQIPYLCKSGSVVDEEYLKIFNKYKNKGQFDDADLLEAGKMFAKLHNKQFEKADKIKSAVKRQYKIKSFSYSIIASWAFAAGVLQRDKDRLRKLYKLSDLSGDIDPLNARAMAIAKHKTDTETYRGLGTRNDEKERGRLLQLFLGYSSSSKPKITEQMCNAAIDIFHSNQDRIAAEQKRKSAF